MTRNILLLLFGTFTLWGHAQNWCPPGAEWLFNFDSQQATGVRRAWYSGDTLVGGLQCQRIEQMILAYEPVFPFGTPFSFQDTPIITHGQGDLVELWDEASQTFDTLAWFGAAPGDQWAVPHFAGIARWDVLDTGTTVVAGMPLRFVVVEEPIVMGIVDTLRERIGFDYYYLRPWESLQVDLTTTGLVCYHDDLLGQVNGGYPLHPCDFTLSVNEEESGSAECFPNPGTDHFTLSLPPGAHSVTLFDALGRQVVQQRTGDGRTIITTDQLPLGVYTVQIDAERTPLRWIKQ